MIKHLPESAQKLLIKIYNNIWNNCTKIPKVWKQFRVIALLKPHKDPQDENSYRPISLIPCLMKVMNNIVKNRLNWIIEKNGMIPPTQFGFRKGKGCADYLLTLVTDIQNSLTYNETTAMASLDISSAYDRVHIPTLLTIMFKKGIPSKFITHCAKFLYDREITFISPEFSIQRTTSKGLPQGSTLSPVLFSIYISEINNNLPQEVSSLQYADDITLYTSSKKEDTVQAILQESLNVTEIYLSKLNLDINANKTNIIIFTRKRKLNENMHFKIGLYDKILLPVKDKIKLLGIEIDNKLTFNSHVNNIVTQCQKDLDIIKSVAYGRKGTHPDFALQIYKSLIRTRMEYCSFLYGHINKQLISKLDKIQNQAMRLAIGAFRSTPIIALQVETVIVPISTRYRILTERIIYKVMIEENHLAYDKLTYLRMLINVHKFWKKKPIPIYIQAMNLIYELNPLIDDCHNKIVNRYQFQSPLYLTNHNITFFSELEDWTKKQNNEISMKQAFYNLLNITSNDQANNNIIVYTDGSKTSQGTGAAFWIPRLKESQIYALHNYNSNYTAEMYAILRAIRYIKTGINIVDKLIIICSDSQSSIKEIENSFHRGDSEGIVLNIVKELLELNNRTIFIWTPGHCGILGNDKADALAKQAVTQGEIITDINIPKEDFKSGQLKLNMNEFYKSFLESTKAATYKKVQTKFHHIPWFKNSNMKRKEISTICRLRFGHANVNALLFKMKLYFTPLCLNCTMAVPETIDHVILQCPKYQYQRNIQFKKINLLIKKNSIHDISQLLLLNDPVIHKEINKFIDSSKIII